MASFHKNIKVDHRWVHFDFYLMQTVEGKQYHVYAIDPNGHSIAFDMKVMKGEWKIVDDSKLPSWITNLEKELEIIIFNNSED